jgi:hypothetical protein
LNSNDIVENKEQNLNKISQIQNTQINQSIQNRMYTQINEIDEYPLDEDNVVIQEENEEESHRDKKAAFSSLNNTKSGSTQRYEIE